MKRKQMFKGLVQGAVATALTVSMAASSMAVNFVDTWGHWAESEIDRWNEEGVVTGYDGYYRPDNYIKRGDMAVMLNQVMEYHVDYVSGTHPNWFPNVNVQDLIGNYYDSSINRLHTAWLMIGSDSYVRPEDFITRQEAAVMLAKAFHLDTSYSPSSSFYSRFGDSNQVSSWALNGVYAMTTSNDYMLGREGNMFAPQDPITRAEVAQILDKMINAFVQQPVNLTGGTYDGNMVINTPSVNLSGDMRIKGDLIIAEGVADGDIHLTDVQVDGNIIVKGGSTNTIYLCGVTASSLEVSRMDAPTLVVLCCATDIPKITVEHDCIIDATDLDDGYEVGKVELNGDGDFSDKPLDVTVWGKVDDIINNYEPTNLTVSGPIGDITLNEDCTVNGTDYDRNDKVDMSTIPGTSATKAPNIVLNSVFPNATGSAMVTHTEPRLDLETGDVTFYVYVSSEKNCAIMADPENAITVPDGVNLSIDVDLIDNGDDDTFGTTVFKVTFNVPNDIDEVELDVNFKFSSDLPDITVEKNFDAVDNKNNDKFADVKLTDVELVMDPDDGSEYIDVTIIVSGMEGVRLPTDNFSAVTIDFGSNEDEDDYPELLSVTKGASSNDMTAYSVKFLWDSEEYPELFESLPLLVNFLDGSNDNEFASGLVTVNEVYPDKDSSATVTMTEPQLDDEGDVWFFTLKIRNIKNCKLADNAMDAMLTLHEDSDTVEHYVTFISETATTITYYVEIDYKSSVDEIIFDLNFVDENELAVPEDIAVSVNPPLETAEGSIDKYWEIGYDSDAAYNPAIVGDEVVIYVTKLDDRTGYTFDASTPFTVVDQDGDAITFDWDAEVADELYKITFDASVDITGVVITAQYELDVLVEGDKITYSKTVDVVNLVTGVTTKVENAASTSSTYQGGKSTTISTDGFPLGDEYQILGYDVGRKLVHWHSYNNPEVDRRILTENFGTYGVSSSGAAKYTFTFYEFTEYMEYNTEVTFVMYLIPLDAGDARSITTWGDPSTVKTSFGTLDSDPGTGDSVWYATAGETVTITTKYTDSDVSIVARTGNVQNIVQNGNVWTFTMPTYGVDITVTDPTDGGTEPDVETHFELELDRLDPNDKTEVTPDSSGVDDDGKVETGTLVTVTPDEAKELESVKVFDKDGKDITDEVKTSDWPTTNGKDYIFEMPEGAASVEVLYRYGVPLTVTGAKEYSVTITSATWTEDDQSAVEGEEITIKAVAGTGYDLGTVTVGGEVVEMKDGSYTFTMPSKDTAITVNFVEEGAKTAVLTFPNDKAEVTVEGDDVESPTDVVVGDKVVVTVDPDQEATFTGLPTGTTPTEGTDASRNKTYTFNMPEANVTVTVEDVVDTTPYDITVDSTIGVQDADGKDITEAVKGDVVTLVLPDDVALKDLTISPTLSLSYDSATGNYTFVMPADDVTIEVTGGATEDEGPYDLTIVVENAPSGTVPTVTVSGITDPFTESGSDVLVGGETFTVDPKTPAGYSTLIIVEGAVNNTPPYEVGKKDVTVKITYTEVSTTGYSISKGTGSDDFTLKGSVSEDIAIGGDAKGGEVVTINFTDALSDSTTKVYKVVLQYNSTVITEYTGYNYYSFTMPLKDVTVTVTEEDGTAAELELQLAATLTGETTGISVDKVVWSDTTGLAIITLNQSISGTHSVTGVTSDTSGVTLNGDATVNGDKIIVPLTVATTVDLSKLVTLTVNLDEVTETFYEIKNASGTGLDFTVDGLSDLAQAKANTYYTITPSSTTALASDEVYKVVIKTKTDSTVEYYSATVAANGTCRFYMPADDVDVTITVVQQGVTYPTLNLVEMGNVNDDTGDIYNLTVSDGTKDITHGSDVTTGTITVTKPTVPTGWTLDVSVDGVDMIGNSQSFIVDPTATTVNVIAYYAPPGVTKTEYTLAKKLEDSSGGAVVSLDVNDLLSLTVGTTQNATKAESGDKVEFTVTDPLNTSGYRIKSITVSEQSGVYTGSGSFYAGGDDSTIIVTVTVEKLYTVTGTGITPPSQQVGEGDYVTVTQTTPPSGTQTANVTMTYTDASDVTITKNVPAGADANTFTFQMPAADVTITATNIDNDDLIDLYKSDNDFKVLVSNVEFAQSGSGTVEKGAVVTIQQGTKTILDASSIEVTQGNLTLPVTAVGGNYQFTVHADSTADVNVKVTYAYTISQKSGTPDFTATTADGAVTLRTTNVKVDTTVSIPQKEDGVITDVKVTAVGGTLIAGFTQPVADSTNPDAPWTFIMPDCAVEVEVTYAYAVTFLTNADTTDYSIGVSVPGQLLVTEYATNAPVGENITFTLNTVDNTEAKVTFVDKDGNLLEVKNPSVGTTTKSFTMPEQSVTIVVTYLVNLTIEIEGLKSEENASVTLATDWKHYDLIDTSTPVLVPINSKVTVGASTLATGYDAYEVTVKKDSDSSTVGVTNSQLFEMPNEDSTLTVTFISSNADREPPTAVKVVIKDADDPSATISTSDGNAAGNWTSGTDYDTSTHEVTLHLINIPLSYDYKANNTSVIAEVAANDGKTTQITVSDVSFVRVNASGTADPTSTSAKLVIKLVTPLTDTTGKQLTCTVYFEKEEVTASAKWVSGGYETTASIASVTEVSGNYEAVVNMRNHADAYPIVLTADVTDSNEIAKMVYLNPADGTVTKISYDSETHTITLTFELKDGVSDPYFEILYGFEVAVTFKRSGSASETYAIAYLGTENVFGSGAPTTSTIGGTLSAKGYDNKIIFVQAGWQLNLSVLCDASKYTSTVVLEDVTQSVTSTMDTDLGYSYVLIGTNFWYTKTLVISFEDVVWNDARIVSGTAFVDDFGTMSGGNAGEYDTGEKIGSVTVRTYSQSTVDFGLTFTFAANTLTANPGTGNVSYKRLWDTVNDKIIIPELTVTLDDDNNTELTYSSVEATYNVDTEVFTVTIGSTVADDNYDTLGASKKQVVSVDFYVQYEEPEKLPIHFATDSLGHTSIPTLYVNGTVSVHEAEVGDTITVYYTYDNSAGTNIEYDDNNWEFDSEIRKANGTTAVTPAVKITESIDDGRFKIEFTMPGEEIYINTKIYK